MKLCNKCEYMIRMSGIHGNTGLCAYHDRRVDADVSTDCQHRRSRKYRRQDPTAEYESLEQPRIDGKVIVDDFASDNTHDLSSIGTIEDRAQQW